MFTLIRRSLTIVVIIAIAIFANMASAVNLTADQKRTLENVAREYNKLTTIKADFEQTTSRGGYANGRLLMQRPGKMRMQYDTANAALIVNGGTTLWWENGGKRNIPTGKTPLTIMTKKNFSFFDKNIDIVGYQENANEVTVTLIWKPRPQDGTLSITMTKTKPVGISRWSISDGKGVEMSVRVSNIKYGQRIPGNLFHTNTPVEWKK